MDASLKTVLAIPNCRCTVLPSCGHWPQLEKPDTYNALALQFLEEVAA